jgi:hypothetical protein
MADLLKRFAALTFGVIIVAFPAAAQNSRTAPAASDKFVVSAKAGGVNMVVGTVGVVKKNGRSGVLVKGDDLKPGDRVSTGPDAKAEILMNPGSYLRLGGNSAFEFRSTDLDNLKVMLHRGSGIFEVFASEDFTVELLTPNSKFVVVDSGVYRVDVGDKTSVLSVWRGKARIGSENGEIVKGGRETSVNGGSIVTAKFDRDEKDSLDEWSKQRSKQLSKMMASLDKRAVRNSLLSSFAGRQWNFYNSFGLWVYDPFRGTYGFLPFGYGWESPYGYGYGRYLGWYNFPPIYYYPTYPNQNPPTGGGSPNPQQPPATTAETRQRGTRVPSGAPPFVQMQRQEGKSLPSRGMDFPGADTSSGSRGVFVQSAPPSPGPSKSEPSETRTMGKQP